MSVSTAGDMLLVTDYWAQCHLAIPISIAVDGATTTTGINDSEGEGGNNVGNGVLAMKIENQPNVAASAASISAAAAASAATARAPREEAKFDTVAAAAECYKVDETTIKTLLASQSNSISDFRPCLPSDPPSNSAAQSHHFQHREDEKKQKQKQKQKQELQLAELATAVVLTKTVNVSSALDNADGAGGVRARTCFKGRRSYNNPDMSTFSKACCALNGAVFVALNGSLCVFAAEDTGWTVQDVRTTHYPTGFFIKFTQGDPA